MALPFSNGSSGKRREQLLAIDLGGRTTKAIHLQRKGTGFALVRYALVDAPIFDRAPSPELLADHLKAVGQAMQTKVKQICLTVGVNDALVRQMELPQMPPDDLRQVLKLNSKNYLQQDLTGYVFDCCILPSRQAKAAEPAKGQPKQKVLIVAVKQEWIDTLVEATKSAGLVPDHIAPGLIGPVNAFEMAMPEVFSREAVALVDIGFKSSSICIVYEGELILTRVVSLGSDRLTAGLAESMNISYAEAEGIKIGMPTEVQSALEGLLSPLGRELRASLDFFEHQHDRPIAHVYVSGGLALSGFLLQLLAQEMMVECKPWNPAVSMQSGLSAEQAAEIQHVAPQLAVSLGAALGAI
jgi:type IV pilus assembly protein PilM